jgi:RNA polymerase sigma-70 factor (ECF subfamily)
MSSGEPIASCAAVGDAHRAERAVRITARELYERHVAEVFRYVSRRVPRLEEAEDITADVFTSAFTALGRFRGHCPPYLWLLTIARRKIVDAGRRRSARRETLASELAGEEAAAAALWQALAPTEGPEATFARSEAGRVLRDLIGKLKPDQREALLLKYWERLSVAEIAVVMARSRAAVNSLLQRARATLYRRGRNYFLDEERERDE